MHTSFFIQDRDVSKSIWSPKCQLNTDCGEMHGNPDHDEHKNWIKTLNQMNGEERVSENVDSEQMKGACPRWWLATDLLDFSLYLKVPHQSSG